MSGAGQGSADFPVGENRAARIIWVRGELNSGQFNDQNATDTIRCIVPKERRFRKTDCKGEIRLHSVRIDASLSDARSEDLTHKLSRWI